MNKEQRAEMLAVAQDMPVEAVRQFELSVKKFFEEENIPWNRDTLEACLVMNSLIHAGLPPMYGQFTATSALLLIRLIQEIDTGLIGSPVHVERKEK